MYTGPAANVEGTISLYFNLAWRWFTQCNSLSKTDKHSATNEAPEIALWRPGLYESRNDGKEATNTHAPSST